MSGVVLRAFVARRAPRPPFRPVPYAIAAYPLLITPQACCPCMRHRVPHQGHSTSAIPLYTLPGHFRPASPLDPPARKPAAAKFTRLFCHSAAFFCGFRHGPHVHCFLHFPSCIQATPCTATAIHQPFLRISGHFSALPAVNLTAPIRFAHICFYNFRSIPVCTVPHPKPQIAASRQPAMQDQYRKNKKCRAPPPQGRTMYLPCGASPPVKWLVVYVYQLTI